MRDWEQAWRRALYGRGGVFRGPRRRPGHFRTAPQVGDEFAEALLELADKVDRALGRPPRLDLIDMGAGGGELAAALHRLRPDSRYRVTAVDVADRPDGLDADVAWRSRLPRGGVGLLIANEWLDSVPCPVVTRHDGAVRRLSVYADGTERLGPPAGAPELHWLDRWWPLDYDSGRAEVGTTRDYAWAQAHRALRSGLLVAVDYQHTRAERPRIGTLTGYRNGRQVPPRPDGTCDLTAHVALDACARTARPLLVSQVDALTALGIRTPAPVGGGLEKLARAGRIAELTDPGGMGAFGWLVEGVGLLPDEVFA